MGLWLRTKSKCSVVTKRAVFNTGLFLLSIIIELNKEWVGRVFNILDECRVSILFRGKESRLTIWKQHLQVSQSFTDWDRITDQNNNYLPTFITRPSECNILLIVIGSYHLYSGLIKPVIQPENRHILHQQYLALKFYKNHRRKPH